MKNCKATSRISKSLVMISIITRKRRIVSVLLLIILSSMGVFGTMILNNLTSRQQNSIEKAISEMVIRGVVTDATGTDTGSLQMISAFVDMLNGNRESSGCYLGQYIHNVRAKGQEPLDSPTDCTLCRILSLDSDQNLTQTEGVVIQFMSGWNEGCLRGNERVCLVSEDVRIIDGYVTISSYSQGQLELQVVGTISGGLKKTIYCPFYMPWEDGTSYAFLTDCCSFDIRDNNLLDETKEELYRWFVRPNPGNVLDGMTFGVVVQDELYQKSIRELKDNLKFLLILQPIMLFLCICMGFLGSYISEHSREKEYAIMRCIGISKRHITILLSIEYGLIVIVGLIFGIVSTSFIDRRMETSSYLYAVLAVLFYMIGALTSVLRIVNANIIKQTKIEE